MGQGRFESYGGGGVISALTQAGVLLIPAAVFPDWELTAEFHWMPLPCREFSASTVVQLAVSTVLVN